MHARAPAPEFPADLGWVNASNAPHVADLRGRVGLLWFWSYDSVNCWNLVPDLRYFEDKYHDGLTVIGVHCPKYPRQCGDEPLLRAVNRHRLRHAVANDAGFRVWRQYGVEAWPSVALIDAEGRFAALFAGEGRRAEIDARIAQLLDEAALHDLRVYEPTPPAQRPEPRRALSFPGKLLADGKLLYVSDSGHHRVLECRHDGRVVRSFGSGDAGFGDGDAAHACFDDPQGLARLDNALYVADRGNHAVRRIDLADGRVETVLGTGRAGRSRPDRADRADPRRTALNTPLDLCAFGGELFIAVAGQNQIWRFDPGAAQVSVFAGSGELGLVDGSAVDACLAQPSGLGVIARHLVVADAAASAVRWVNVDEGRVDTAVGFGLYESGDATGAHGDVRLQNPLAVAVDPRGTVYVADSYNNSIKLLNRKSGDARPLRLRYRLHEPGGLSLAGNLLWIANTNLHEIACVDLATGMVRRVPVGED
ncbi:thioredoxin-like domain-containing protein [Dokdonella soli]|uniref:Thioredoxin-like domain-containing protein n=1 Tax=Dokdonella soli TaxID=529810 RepID=A0ABP3TM36_9GAMM